MYYLLIKSLHLIFVLLHLINIIQSELVALITETTNIVILGLVISCVTARCRQEFLIDTLLGNEYFLTVLPV